MRRAAIVYQFCILATIIGLIVFFAITKGELNETLIGALIGVMGGLSFKITEDAEIEEIHPKNNGDDV